PRGAAGHGAAARAVRRALRGLAGRRLRLPGGRGEAPSPTWVPSGGTATLPVARPLHAVTWARRTNPGGTAPPRRLFPVTPSPPRLDGAVPWPLLTRRRRARRTSPLPRHRQRQLPAATGRRREGHHRGREADHAASERPRVRHLRGPLPRLRRAARPLPHLPRRAAVRARVGPAVAGLRGPPERAREPHR